MDVGLVLSGGIAKGAYQVGVLQVFRQCLPSDFFSHISASSVGVLNAYAYLTDQLEAAEEIWKNQKYTGMLGFIRSFVKDSYLDTLMSKIQPRPIGHACDFYISALSLSNFRLSYINVKNVAPDDMWTYLKAGVALPPFRAPVKIRGERFVDGAMIDNIPVYPLVAHQPDLTVVQYFDREDIVFENEAFNSRVIRLAFEEGKILHDSFAFDRQSVCEMIDVGKQTALRIIREYRLDDFDSLDDLYSRIRENTPAKQTMRITGDMLVNNFNVVAKKLIKYSVMKDEEQLPDSGKIVTVENLDQENNKER